MKQVKVYQVDSFTQHKFRGNPAGVVTHADELSDQEMQQLARELNNSETVFLLAPTDLSHAVWLRFFTPTVEVPLCGHATIAAHYVRAHELQLGSCQLQHKTGAGILPIEIIQTDNDYQIIMTQAAIEFGPIIDGQFKQALLDALGLTIHDLHYACPIQIVSTGHAKVLIGINQRTTLDALRPNFAALTLLSKQIGCNGYFVFTLDSDDPAILSYGRMFSPAIGVNEDPVTGNANGPLGAYLVQHRLVAHNGAYLRFTACQGVAIGRTGYIDVQVLIEQDTPVLVKVGGHAVIVFQTTIQL